MMKWARKPMRPQVLLLMIYKLLRGELSINEFFDGIPTAYFEYYGRNTYNDTLMVNYYLRY